MSVCKTSYAGKYATKVNILFGMAKWLLGYFLCPWWIEFRYSNPAIYSIAAPCHVTEHFTDYP